MQKNDQHSSPQSRGKKLRTLRKMSGLTLNELADKYGIGVSTIKYWESAKNEGLSDKGAKKIITAMQKEGIQCSYMWLMHGVGLPPQFVNIQYSEASKQAFVSDPNRMEEETAISHEISTFCDRINDAITLTVFDDGMEPLYTIGDSVGGKRFFGENLEKVIGKNCIIETADHQLLCRRIARGKSPEYFNLYCINPHTISSPPNLYNTQIISAAPIVRIWKRIII